MKNRTQMTRILRMIADFISANPFDQRHLRSIKKQSELPKTRRLC